MKKLSTEEKAKAYDKVREKIALRFGSNVAKEIFSEFEESEDEKIKKWIRKELESKYVVDNIVNNVMADKAFAWLEKQGKNNMGISEATKQELEDNLNKALEKETPESLNEFLDEQGGQKPAWSKEMGNLCLDATSLLRDYADGVDKDSQLGQKINRAVAFLTDLYHEAFYPNTYNPRPDLRSPEWSEEDEYCINQLIVFCEHCMVQDSGAKRCAQWLKSLRPQNRWKPSDEMLKALYRAIPENTMEISEDEMLLDKLYQGLKYGRVLSKK